MNEQGARVNSLTIESLAYGGDGVAHLEDGRTAFVAGTVPGDVVDFELLEDHPRFVKGRAAEVLTASPDRITAPCPYFGVCGGCTWQHVSYAAQLTAKRRAVLDALTRIGHIEGAEALVAQTVPSAAEYGYRNKVELVVDTTSGRPRLGFHRAASDEVVPVDECLLLPKALRKAPKALGGALRYVSGEQDFGLTRVAVRVATHTRDVEVALWGAPGPFPRKAVATTLGSALNTTSLVRVMTKGPAKERRIAGVEVLSGKGMWRERLGGATMSISAPSFFQVNTKGAETLVSLVAAGLEVDGSDRVLDLYAGAGTFTLPLAELAGEVVAVEAAGSAVRDLRRNLENAEVWADVIGGDAARELPSIGHIDAAVVDPPRSGLHPSAAAALAATGARTIAYVSCDPSTLARDAVALIERGYALTLATPVDLFPQ
ncbi:MAG: 23S rRNA (uracil(1939)-C(5))-methyltransferase RlmD, partial [Coriobacteriia bacterium]|nr:23S rRNA (uracil(1939)-C(5))-methyltransferase RlmD [Coriobacteriia bacterium]